MGQYIYNYVAITFFLFICGVCDKTVIKIIIIIINKLCCINN